MSSFVTLHLWPNNEKLVGKQSEYLVRSASLICSSFAFYRGLLPPEDFSFIPIMKSEKYPVFKGDRGSKAELHKESFKALTDVVHEKKVSHT